KTGVFAENVKFRVVLTSVHLSFPESRIAIKALEFVLSRNLIIPLLKKRNLQKQVRRKFFRRLRELIKFPALNHGFWSTVISARRTFEFPAFQMADNELSRKLNRRLQLNEEPTAGPESENGKNVAHAPDPDRLLAAPRPQLQRKISSSSSTGSEKGISDSASNELSKKLSRRQDINDGAAGEDFKPRQLAFNPYTEFREFARKQVKEYENIFKQHDVNHDHFICLDELKKMMEKLGAPQTHLALKRMIAEVDEDRDGKLNFREFLLIFRKAAAGELADDSGLSTLANLTEIDVDKTGVIGAKGFFEAKIEKISKGSRFEEEIKAEQEQLKKEANEKKQRRQDFKQKAALFGTGQ
ncbi:EF-hand domain-containing protein D2, partial [Hypsibius exemplaris]